MSDLSREELFEVCRAIYKVAGDNFMLPPLIRDAKSLDASSHYTYSGQTENNRIRLVVEFDKDYVDNSKFPLEKLPLRFKCEICDVNSKDYPVELGEIERKALIRAFFLGVKLQFIAEKNALASNYRFCIQLSQTFFVACGERIDEREDLTAEAICHQVGQGLYDKSSEFFANPQDGLLVWSARAAQELFGEQKPSPEDFWPRNSIVVEETALQCVGASVPATLPVCSGSRGSAVGHALVTTSVLTNPPILAVSSVHLPSAFMKAARRFSHSGIAILMVVGIAGLTLCYAFRSDYSALPRKATVNALAASEAFLPERTASLEAPADHALSLDRPPQISQVQSVDAPEAAAKLSGAAPAPDVAAQIVANAAPAPPLDTAAAQISAPAPKSVTAASSGDGGKKLQKKGSAAINAASPHPGQSKLSAHAARHNQVGPLVAVRRAINSLAAGIGKNLRQIPHRLSSLISRQ